jgi:hypothetical protein
VVLGLPDCIPLAVDMLALTLLLFGFCGWSASGLTGENANWGFQAESLKTLVV